jgi:ABC-2 type transport system ATP-binding protein
MEEAARLCSRIGVIDHGKILAVGTLDELLARLPFEDEIAFTLPTPPPSFVADLLRLGTVATTDSIHRFRPHRGTKLSAFYAAAEAHAVPPRIFTHERPTLEAVFLHLTGRTLRE